jgi:hypothetical protein
LNQYHIYIFTLFALASFSAFVVFWVCKPLPASPGKWEKLPRNILFGVIIAAADLAWCVPHSKPIAPDSMVPWLIPIAIVCLWLIYQFLDYIFSRAFGGFLILFAHYLLYASFVYKAPAKPFLSLLCFAMGTLGIFFCGKPYLMRDLIRKIVASSKWRYSTVAVMTVYGVTALVIGILQIYHKW